jgi:hypothetical protein
MNRGARVAAALVCFGIVAVATAPAAGAAPWKPAPGTTWQWQLSGKLDLSVAASVYDVDLFETPAATVQKLHNKGRRVICYLSAGSFEEWRPDAARFPAAVVGKPLDGWPGESWLDIRRIDVLGPIMEARLDLCRAKGFNAVEPDNIDGYSNRSGFPLTAAHQLAYNRWLAKEAHERGLSIGLKNDPEQVGQLVASFDFAIVEQCFQYDECDAYRPFIAAGKAVFETEYSLGVNRFCPEARALGFSAMKKRLALDAWRKAC